MAEAILIKRGGGGGTGSDELTATAGDVVKGKTAVTSDSNDEAIPGTLELTGNAGAADVLAPKTFYTTDPKTKQTGTMVDKSGTSQSASGTLDTTNSRVNLTVPATGKYSITSKLYIAYSTLATLIGLTAAKIAAGITILGIAGTFSDDGTATAAQILTGMVAYVKGKKVTGTMANNGEISGTLAAGGSKAIPAGYTTGGTVTASSLASQTVADATAGDILNGKKAWVNGAKVTGTLPTKSGWTVTPSASAQTLSVSGYKMTSDIVVSAVSAGAFGAKTKESATRAFTLTSGSTTNRSYLRIAGALSAKTIKAFFAWSYTTVGSNKVYDISWTGSDGTVYVRRLALSSQDFSAVTYDINLTSCVDGDDLCIPLFTSYTGSVEYFYVAL